jgi:hypothetical protein
MGLRSLSIWPGRTSTKGALIAVDETPASKPKPLIDKLGVKPGARVATIGVDESWFVDALRNRTTDVSVGRARRASDVVFVFVDRREDLDRRIARFRGSLKPNGALWVIRPKGTPAIKEMDVIEAGKRAGLVDNKIASFSETLSAMRLVIPLAER